MTIVLRPPLACGGWKFSVWVRGSDNRVTFVSHAQGWLEAQQKVAEYFASFYERFYVP